ncbi:MAG: hypothetical protein Q7T04_02355 [Dehalococcoidia bacterium]|nr:hypothetical protein [Dehalococcoidia bacterium]
MPQNITPLEALKAIMNLIGDKDLPDNGKLNGAAICDLARSAINAADNTSEVSIKISKTPKAFACESAGDVNRQAYCVTDKDVRSWVRYITDQMLLLLK